VKQEAAATEADRTAYDVRYCHRTEQII